MALSWNKTVYYSKGKITNYVYYQLWISTIYERQSIPLLISINTPQYKCKLQKNILSGMFSCVHMGWNCERAARNVTSTEFV